MSCQRKTGRRKHHAPDLLLTLNSRYLHPLRPLLLPLLLPCIVLYYVHAHVDQEDEGGIFLPSDHLLYNVGTCEPPRLRVPQLGNVLGVERREDQLARHLPEKLISLGEKG